MCLSAIDWARIDGVVYANTYEQAGQIGFDDHFIFKELTRAHKDKQISMAQINDKSALKDALDVFHAWNNSQTKQSY